MAEYMAALTDDADKVLIGRLIDAQLAQGDMLPLSANNPDYIFTFDLTDNVASSTDYAGPKLTMQPIPH